MSAEGGGRALSAEALAFAPGLLSIQESPPAPLPRVVLYAILILFALLVLWATLGRLDVIASAEGQLVPRTYLKSCVASMRSSREGRWREL